MTAINPTPMATLHIGVGQDLSSSPPLTKSELVSSALLPSPPTSPSRQVPRPNAWSQLDAGSDEAVSTTTTTTMTTTTALRMPVRIKAGPPSSVPLSYFGHDQGTTLSDIGEEESTPGSKAGRRSSGIGPGSSEQSARSVSHSPTQSQASPLGHKSRRSIQSLSEASDVDDWENFEPSKMISGRLAADVARDDDDADGDGVESRRSSSVNGDADELALLNAKAERILAHARLRLTSMEDNLTKARHSIFLSGDSVSPVSVRSSPSMSELHQPAGGLYRSISLASRKTKPLQLVAKTQQQMHVRGLSDNSNNKLKTLSMVPAAEARASSAQEHRRRYESPQPPTPTLPRFMRLNAQSPTSSGSVNSPPVREDGEDASPSTVKTSPESPFSHHGLGINTLARQTKDDLSMAFPTTCSPSPPSGPRTVSSASTTRSMREQVSELKDRISNLQTKTRADRERSLVYQSRSTPSPFTNSSNPERWYGGAPEYREGGSRLNANAGIGWSPSHDRAFVDYAVQSPVTPQTQRFLLDGEPHLPSTGDTGRLDIRTDVNTPSLAERATRLHAAAAAAATTDDGHSSIADGAVPESLYEDAAQGFDEQDDVAASEEEQIYLNEVLEESLQEIEPDVADASDDFALAQEGAERHEDRLDAFDYENMFLHSALGNFASSAYRDSASSGTSSAASDRTTLLTPTADRPGFDDHEGDAAEGGEGDDDETVFDLDGRRRTTPTPFDVGEATPTRLEPPWTRHPQRSQSIESVSTVATFITATEGRDDDDSSQGDEAPDEILSWGNSGSAFPAPPFLRPAPRTRGSASAASPVERPVQQSGRAVGPQQGSARAVSPARAPAQPGPTQQHPANTEILMESLIKLADPDFRVQESGVRFADVDKDLVLSLLRAVGTVCDGVLKADRAGRADEVRALRRQLDWGRRVLEDDGRRQRADG